MSFWNGLRSALSKEKTSKHLFAWGTFFLVCIGAVAVARGQAARVDVPEIVMTGNRQPLAIAIAELQLTGNRDPYPVSTQSVELSGNRDPYAISTQSIELTGNRGVDEP